MVAFYKHDIHAWRGGTASLSDRAYRVYHVIIEEIMAREGSIFLHKKSLADLSNRSIRDLDAALSELQSAGKISIVDGRIHCDPARSLIDNRSGAVRNRSRF
jgi:hypothetical protein